LAVVGYFFQKEINSGIEFATLEQQGVAYDRPVTRLLMDVLNHQQSVNFHLLAKTTSTDEITTQQNTIADDIKAVDAMDKAYKDSLKASQDWTKLQGEWQDLKGRVSNLDIQQSLDSHATLIGDTLSFITTIGNNSNLILDPDVDSYYIMDT